MSDRDPKLILMCARDRVFKEARTLAEDMTGNNYLEHAIEWAGLDEFSKADRALYAEYRQKFWERP